MATVPNFFRGEYIFRALEVVLITQNFSLVFSRRQNTLIPNRDLAIPFEPLSICYHEDHIRIIGTDQYSMDHLRFPWSQACHPIIGRGLLEASTT